MQLTAEQLYKIRKVYRLTQADIGALADVSDAYINQVELGKRKLSRKVNDKIVEELRLSPDKLSQILAVFKEYEIKRMS